VAAVDSVHIWCPPLAVADHPQCVCRYTQPHELAEHSQSHQAAALKMFANPSKNGKPSKRPIVCSCGRVFSNGEQPTIYPTIYPLIHLPLLQINRSGFNLPAPSSQLTAPIFPLFGSVETLCWPVKMSSG
jgi:hypothetical protein